MSVGNYPGIAGGNHRDRTFLFRTGASGSISVSMAEMTALGAKQLDNARVIGKRTWGGVCGPDGDGGLATATVTVDKEPHFYDLQL